MIGRQFLNDCNPPRPVCGGCTTHESVNRLAIEISALHPARNMELMMARYELAANRPTRIHGHCWHGTCIFASNARR